MPNKSQERPLSLLLLLQLEARVPAPKDQAEFAAEGKWVEEAELAEIFGHLEQRALAAARAKPNTLEAAKLVQDACLGGMAFLHFPPFRPGVLRELVLHASSAAPRPACAHDGPCEQREAQLETLRCRGNLLSRLGARVFTLLLTHHKNEARWGRRPMGPLQVDQKSVTAEFTELLEAHATWGMPLLCGGDPAHVGHHFFVNNDGAPWGDTGLTQRLPRLVEREMAQMGKDKAHISFTMLRRIFVDGMRESGTRGSTFERGSAMLMGNSICEWDRTYDLNFKV